MSILTTGLKELESSYRKFGAVTRRGEMRALRRVGTTIVAQQSRSLAQLMNLRIGTIKKEIQTVRQPSAHNLSVVFQVRSKGIPLKEFTGSRVTRKGLSVQPLKTNARSVLRAGFAVAKFGGHYFGRAGKHGKGYRSPHVGRGPIVKLYGPSVLSQYEKAEIQKVGADVWGTRLPIELEREVDHALKQAGLI
jgi:hypothetical protein